MYFPTSQQRKANLVHQMHIKSKPILEVQENIGKTLVFAIDNDDYYTVLNYFCRNMRSTMNSEFIKSLWDILESTNGQFINVIETEAKIEEPYNVIYIKCQFEHQIKTLSFSFAKKNVVYGFDLMGS